MPMIASELAAMIKDKLKDAKETDPGLTDGTDALAEAIVDYLKANATVVITPIPVTVIVAGVAGTGNTTPTTATLT